MSTKQTITPVLHCIWQTDVEALKPDVPAVNAVIADMTGAVDVLIYTIRYDREFNVDS